MGRGFITNIELLLSLTFFGKNEFGGRDIVVFRVLFSISTDRKSMDLSKLGLINFQKKILDNFPLT